MGNVLRAPAAATAQGPRKSDQQDCSINSEHTRKQTANQALEFHPLADIFPLMKGTEFDELVADIKAHGLREEIVLYDGMVLDGRNRYRACLAAGWEPHAIEAMSWDGDSLIDDPAAYVISANIRRRHLKAEERIRFLAEIVARAPEKSDRQHAKENVDHKTVAKAQAVGEDVGTIPHVEKRTDTKGRKQPAKRGWSRERFQRHRATKRGSPQVGASHDEKTTRALDLADQQNQPVATFTVTNGDGKQVVAVVPPVKQVEQPLNTVAKAIDGIDPDWTKVGVERLALKLVEKDRGFARVLHDVLGRLLGEMTP
jgi:ParB-like chromosome segregation protein Spo0J